MASSLIKEFYRTIHLDDLTISYSGRFTDNMTEKIIELSEAYLNSNTKLSNLKRRTSFLVAECFQNVVRHSTKEYEAAQIDNLNESFFLRFYENKCFIASENLIHNDHVESLKARLDKVNKYNKDELKSVYMSILNEGDFSEEGGAGLGLVEMARKTGNKLMYSFDYQENNYSLFYLMIVLENKEADGPVANYLKDLEDLKRIIKHVQQDNIFVLYKGDFGEEIVSHIEEILERNLDTQPDSLATKVKLYNAAILTMHKIGRYSHQNGRKESGMLFFARNDNSYIINATFPVSDETKEELDRLLSEIKISSREKLEQDHQDQLKIRTMNNIAPPGLGFTQLVLISKSWDYEFDKPTNMSQEFVFQVYI